METRVFFIEEHKGTTFDSEQIEKWQSLVQELGLEKQTKLITENKSPIPFAVMSELQSTIWGAVLDWKVSYKEFEHEAIPVEILSTIALCEREKYFDKIEIWFSRQMPDPLVVGKRYNTDSDREKAYTWAMVSYLVASWGSQIKPAEELIDQYDALQRDCFKDSYDYNIKAHEEKMKKFRFQSQAFSH